MVVDDDPALNELLAKVLSEVRFDVETFTEAETALEAAHARRFDAALIDVHLGSSCGTALCRRLTEDFAGLPVVMITGAATMETAVDSLRAGAFDFIQKPFELEAVSCLVARAVVRRRIKDALVRLDCNQASPPQFGAMLGGSSAMRSVFELLGRIEESDAPVLITGESGTGKELVARGLHERGRHRQGPFVAVNCAAVPAMLLESTLFGHVKGAFTDAKSSHDGLFVQAHHGTLFLDEIGEMALEI